MVSSTNRCAYPWILLMLFSSLFFTSCTTRSPETGTATTALEQPGSQAPSLLPEPEITSTPAALALKVNQAGISLAEFDQQKQQLMSASQSTGETLTDEEVNQLLVEYFTDLELLAQAANQAGYNPTQADVEARYMELKQKAGGEDLFQNWLDLNGYTPDTFLGMYRRELAAQWQREQILNTLGDTAEQIHARQILVSSADLAEQIASQLRGGSDFSSLAEEYDPVTKGDLGWFPRGYLFLPEIEEAVFALQPGQFTEVIASAYGYHIVWVDEREPDRPLSAGARNQLAHLALDRWLDEQRTLSTIEVLLP